MYLNLVNLVIPIIIQGIILKYALENEKDNCECALTWHHKFIKIFAPIIIIMSIITFITKSLQGNNPNKINKYILGSIFSILLIYGLAHIAYTILLMIYFFKLQKESNCECSKDWKRNVLTVPLVIGVIGFLIGFFYGLFKFAHKSKKII